MSIEHKTADAPLITTAMLLVSILCIPLVLLLVFFVWPESLARQVAAVGAVISIVILALFRRKYEAMLLATVFLSQFYLSLHSFDLAPPVKLQIFFSDVVLAVLVLVAIERRVRIRLDSLGWLFLTLWFWFAITTITSVHPHRSLIFLFSQFKYLLLYGLALNTQMNEKLAGRIGNAVLGVVIIQAVLAIAQTLKGGPLGLQILGEILGDNLQGYMVAGKLRASGTIAGTNSYGGYMAMLLVFLAPFLLVRRSLLLYSGFTIGCMALILALSRAAWLSFTVGAICVVIMLLRSGLVRITRLLMVAIVGSFVLSIGVGMYYDKIMHRFRDREAIQSAEGRFKQIEGAWKVVEKYPLTGIGPGVTEFFGRWNNNHKYIAKAMPRVNLPNQVHSSQLQVAIESGILGLFLMLLLTATLVLAVFRKVRTTLPNDNQALVRVGGTCAAVAVMVHISFGTEFNSHQIFLGFWTLLGLARSQMGIDPATGDSLDVRGHPATTRLT